MLKSTPGPWRVNAKYKMSVESVADGQGMNIIAECSDPDSERTVEEDMANARLIASAPCLLRQLIAAERELTLLLDRYIPNPAAHSVARGVAEVSRAAIAKATS